MRPAARQIARLLPVPRSVKPRLLELAECPHCRSRYVQPTDWKALPSGKVSMAMRCPECLVWMSGTFSADRVRELDRTLKTGRADLRTLYEHTVRSNMHRELRALRRALELDLIGADDFRPAARGARRRVLDGSRGAVSHAGVRAGRRPSSGLA